ncbi:MAG: 16S rRNA (cytosine(1402)-N(4))-methyltransferase RsmH [Thermoanaerobaculia bacterium]
MQHLPVLVEETIGFLEPGRGGLFVDCTLGLGGHAAALLAAGPSVELIGIDRDPEALALAKKRLLSQGRRVRILEGNFANLEDLLAREGVERADGILADLGVSSLQLEEAARGFSFRREGPLDMRMGLSGPTAADIVNRYSEADLEGIFRQYGEERKARRIARALVERRRQKPFATTTELRGVVERAKRAGRPVGRERIDPATRVFQALRIEVNQELAGLRQLLDQAVRLLERDGRLVVISYHSLEDRLVKGTFRDLSRGEIDEVTGRPRSESRVIEVLTRRPVRPSSAEVEANPRARSARLRAARRL